MNEWPQSNGDVVDVAVTCRDHERLVDMCSHPPPADARLGHDVIHRPHLVTADRVRGLGGRFDDSVLRSAFQAAPQMTSGKPGLDALFDTDAAGGEGDCVTVVAHQCVDVGLGGCNAVVVGDGTA